MTPEEKIQVLKDESIRGVAFTTNVKDLTQKDWQYFMDIVEKKNGGTLDNVTEIIVDDIGDGEVDLSYKTYAPFERIRRITGYLSKVENWNDGKRAELADRVKHA